MVILKVILILGRFKEDMRLRFSITLLDYDGLGLTNFYDSKIWHDLDKKLLS
jgi:hypothetical protein